MDLKFIVISLMLSFSQACMSASLPPEDTFDATYWKSIDNNDKRIFLQGASCAVDTRFKISQSEPVFLNSVAIPKLIPIVDGFYSDPKNEKVSLRLAIGISLMKLAGKPQKDIEALISTAKYQSLNSD